MFNKIVNFRCSCVLAGVLLFNLLFAFYSVPVHAETLVSNRPHSASGKVLDDKKMPERRQVSTDGVAGKWEKDASAKEIKKAKKAALKAEKRAARKKAKAIKKALKAKKAEEKKQAKFRQSKAKNKEVKKTKSDLKQLSIGDSGWKVKITQKKLKTLGYQPGEVDGVFTKKLSVALKNFQKDRKISVTGKLDADTYDRLVWEAFALNGNKKVKGKSIIKTAANYKGTVYRYGGRTPDGFDCSGYVCYVFEKNGIKLPRIANAQITEGVFVLQKELKPGDLVFFTTYQKGPSHVGIYAGKKKFWNATSSRGVMLCNLNDEYWRTRYVGGRRVLVSNGCR